MAIRGDGAAPHTMENSQRKAYTALTFGVPSAGVRQAREAENPTLGLAHLNGVITAGQGGLPIKSVGDVIGAVGVSGVPNGADKEEACAQALASTALPTNLQVTGGNGCSNLPLFIQPYAGRPEKSA